ncbi:MAG TPA: alkaline phosphatase D family protein [Candidatus Dormibacteraeota bacterium]|nr:alkaline phosphatase D family protein [Candidatus Dormibacteraeota bacterium]
MVALLLGPVLRHVGEHDATIWVETVAPCEVEVRAGDVAGRSPTFAVGGHHYAVVVLTGLPAASSTPYEVRIDDAQVWPMEQSPFPASRIRTLDTSRPIRLLFGSCREAPRRGQDTGERVDVLEAFATRMLSQDHQAWPELLVFAGDQVYADDTTPNMRKFISSRRDIRRPPKAEVADFEEYTRLYLESWGVPKIRWLLSTMPTSMIFDDHDVHDDWNTSHAWRVDMQKEPWWDARITGALMSYWIYQHLGNLSPAGLEADRTYRAVREVADAEELLREFARAADREADGAKGAMWSYRRDFGPVRLLVIDSRCGRILADDRRSMISDGEFDWIERQATDGPVEHLVVVTSMPWLLPRALHDIESWNEALCAGSRGRLLGRAAEWVRRAVDLEHWAAFRLSFDRLTALFERVGRGEHGEKPPATICVLSGDVHHSYVSEADYPRPLASRVFQITCSPLENTIPLAMRGVFHIGWSKHVARFVRLLGRLTRVPPLPIYWHHPLGPLFGNMLSLLTFDGGSAHVHFEGSAAPDRRARREQPGAKADLEVLGEVRLTEPRATP